MKLGLITDIHEHDVTLWLALARLAELRVDKIVLLPSFVPAIRRCRYSSGSRPHGPATLASR